MHARAALQPARHQRQAQRKAERRRRDVHAQRSEPQSFEAQGQLLDHERRQRLEIEIGHTHHTDER